MVKLASDFFPTLIAIVVAVLWAIIIVCNSNRNQQEILDEVKQAQQKRLDATLEEIRKRMDDEELWQKVESRFQESK